MRALLICSLVLACAFATKTAKVINGQKAVAGGSPDIVWQVRVISGPDLCGGSIIDANFILTAAHCMRTIDDTAKTQTDVTASQVSASTGIDAFGTVFQVSDFWLHPSYLLSTDPTQRVDLAVLKLVKNITFSSTVNKIAMDDGTCATCRANGAAYVTSGYGNTLSSVSGGNTQQSSVLLFTNLVGTTLANCQSVCPFQLPVSTLCAGSGGNCLNTNTGCSDACTGDSGGPLVFNAGSLASPSWILVGAVQAGTVPSNSKTQAQCGQKGTFGTYTTVFDNRATFIDPIVSGANTNPTSSCGSSCGGGGGSNNPLKCFHEDSLISYKDAPARPIKDFEARLIKDCLVPHKFVGDGVSVQTSCGDKPLRLSREHLVFAKSGLVAASSLKAGDVVYASVDETKTCTVKSVTEETKQVYMGLNCRESVVVANGVKVSTFESQHFIPSLWMRWVPAVLGLDGASRVGEVLTNLFRSLHIA